ncbi:MAG: 2-C-methyl-D-erythritol 4-phosphate cytidylyltransferase [Clostridia bacterium]|nr:2-C-methyl-D-erythritol 4-phosphate cytidylyltransferase [Clostridia bacterium]
MRKEKDVFVSAVIVAAGKGSRMNTDINKQYLEIVDVPVLARTLRAFDECAFVTEIVLVVNEAEILYCKQNIVDRFGFNKVKCLVSGGRERQESVFKGLNEVDPGCDVVFIHDGARPFIRQESLEACLDAALEHGAGCIAVPVKDTIKQVDADNFIAATPERSMLWAIQTPQVFKYDIILDAHKKAAQEGFRATDDAMLAERAGVKVKLVMGDYFNIKITTQEDLLFANAIADYYQDRR